MKSSAQRFFAGGQDGGTGQPDAQSFLPGEGRGAIRTFDASARWVPYCAAWNHTGQPAASVPAGLTSDGFPLAVQLVGPPDGEALLLSLSAQLEADLDWPSARPPL